MISRTIASWFAAFANAKVPDETILSKSIPWNPTVLWTYLLEYGIIKRTLLVLLH